VTTVKIFYNERPSAPPAVCAQVPDVSASLAAATIAHPIAVGNRAVQSGPFVGASQIRARRTQLQGRGVRVYGATGSTVAGNSMVKAVDVVGGVPPRGRPV
jgi:hypothetical protein